MNSPVNPSTNAPRILWSCVARNDTILAEATASSLRRGRRLPNSDANGREANEDPWNAVDETLSQQTATAVAQTARELLAKPATPGFEFHTTRFLGATLAGLTQKTKLGGHTKKQNHSTPPPLPSTTLHPKALKGIKFHLYDHVNPHDDFDADFKAATTTTAATSSLPASANTQSSQAQLVIWVFAAVYDPTTTTEKADVQAFLEKMVHLTENFRLYDATWYSSDTLGLQESFAPILQQRMDEYTGIVKMSRIEHSIEACQEQMERNIQLLLDRGDKIADLDEHATRLQEMAVVFQKRARTVKRYQMRQNAKHGLLLGTAVTAATAVVVVPPLVALL